MIYFIYYEIDFSLLTSYKHGKRREKKDVYFIIYVSSPEASKSSIVRMGGEDRRISGPCFIYVLNYNQRFTDGSAMVEENWDFAIHRVGLKKKVAFGVQRFFKVLMFKGFDVQRNLHSHRIRT